MRIYSFIRRCLVVCPYGLRSDYKHHVRVQEDTFQPSFLCQLVVTHAYYIPTQITGEEQKSRTSLPCNFPHSLSNWTRIPCGYGRGRFVSLITKASDSFQFWASSHPRNTFSQDPLPSPKLKIPRRLQTCAVLGREACLSIGH